MSTIVCGRGMPLASRMEALSLKGDLSANKENIGQVTRPVSPQSMGTHRVVSVQQPSQPADLVTRVLQELVQEPLSKGVAVQELYSRIIAYAPRGGELFARDERASSKSRIIALASKSFNQQMTAFIDFLVRHDAVACPTRKDAFTKLSSEGGLLDALGCEVIRREKRIEQEAFYRDCLAMKQKYDKPIWAFENKHFDDQVYAKADHFMGDPCKFLYNSRLVREAGVSITLTNEIVRVIFEYVHLPLVRLGTNTTKERVLEILSTLPRIQNVPVSYDNLVRARNVFFACFAEDAQMFITASVQSGKYKTREEAQEFLFSSSLLGLLGPVTCLTNAFWDQDVLKAKTKRDEYQRLLTLGQ